MYVYDGLPAFVGRYAGSRLLASLCTDDMPEDQLTLEAASGVMAVYYAEVPMCRSV